MPRFTLVFTPESKIDVTEAAEYYDSQLHGLGKRFKAKVRAQLLLLKENPHTRSVRYADVRFALLEKFPYAIHFTINGDKVMIHAVLCDYRDPDKYWIHGKK